MAKELREAISEEAMFPHGAVNVTGIASGFNRNNTSEMGQMEYCISASSGEYWRIYKDYGTTASPTKPVKITGATEFSDGTTLADRTLVQFPTSGNSSFAYWYRGERIVKTTTQSIQFAANTEQYVFYNSAGVLTAQTDETGHDLIVDESLMAFISTMPYSQFADERHGIVMDGETHYKMHFSTAGGFCHHAGGDIATIANGSDAHGAVSDAGYFDEDILTVVAGDPNGDATLPHIYRDITASVTTWLKTASTAKLAHLVSTVAQWDDEGTLTPLTGTQFTHSTFWATNNVIHPVVKMVGQHMYDDGNANASRKLARRHIEQDVLNIRLAGLPDPEMMMFGAVLVDADGECVIGEDKELWIDYRAGFSADRY